MDSVIASGMINIGLPASSSGHFPIQSSRTDVGGYTSRRNVIPITCSLQNIYLTTVESPGGADTYTFTVVKNAIDTAAVMTITGAGASASDTSHIISLSPGDTVAVRIDTSATAVTLNTVHFTCILRTTTSNVSCILSSNGTGLPTGTTSYVGIQQGDSTSPPAAAANVTAVFPTTGNFQNFYVQLANTPGTSKSYQFTLYKNGSATSVVLTVSGAATAANDTSTVVSAAPGDYFYWEVIPSGTPTARQVQLGIGFTPAMPGESVGCVVQAPASNTTVSRFFLSNLSTSAVETDRQIMVTACTIRSLYLRTDTAPGSGGSGKSLLVQVSKNTTAGNPSATLLETATTASDLTHTLSVATQDLLAFKSTATSTPATGRLSAGLVFYIPVISGGNLTMMGVG